MNSLCALSTGQLARGCKESCGILQTGGYSLGEGFFFLTEAKFIWRNINHLQVYD